MHVTLKCFPWQPLGTFELASFRANFLAVPSAVFFAAERVEYRAPRLGYPLWISSALSADNLFVVAVFVVMSPQLRGSIGESDLPHF